MRSRRRQAVASTIALALGAALVLTVSLATDTEPGRGVEAAAQCRPDMPQRSQAEVTLDPSSGLAGTSFNVAVAGMKQNDTGVEIYWDSIGEDNLLHSGSKSGGPTTYNADVQAPDDATVTQHWVIVCAGGADVGWWWQEAVFEVIAPPESPTPTPTPTPSPTETPTPTPTPTPTLDQMYNCPQAGKWAIVVWQGADGVAADEALATCGEGAVDAAYALDASSGEWLRWFPDRPEISKLSMVENMQGFFAFGSSTASPTPTVGPAPPEPGRMRGCPLPGRWAIAVWEGPDASEAGAALDTCGVWQADVAYSLDPETGGWARWFRNRRELSTLDTLPNFQSAVVQGAWVISDLIAFASDRDGNAEIYVMNADGTGQTRLTYSPDGDDEPTWSPDGTKIAFISRRDGDEEIYVMNANGTMQANLTNYQFALEKDPAWSPDGTKIAFTSHTSDWEEIYVMNADGTGMTRLTNNAAYDYSPAWSPDGTKIAFHSDRNGNYDIYVMNANGTVQANATLNAAEDSDPAWSPDGTKIAFTSNRDGDHDIYVMNADGTGQTRLTFYSVRDDIKPSWSPDGTKIAFQAAWAGGNPDIWVMNADGTVRTVVLTTDDASDAQPAWSP